MMRLRRSRLTHQQSDRLLEHFVAGTPARSAAALVGVNRNTARLFYHRLREIIAEHLSPSSLHAPEVVAAVGPPVGSNRSKGKRQSAVEAPLFGLFLRHGKVLTVPVRAEPHASSPSVLKTKARLAAIVYGNPSAERGALDASRFHHRRLAEARRNARGRPQIDRIENFWSQAKRHLRRFNGIPRAHFHLFLKECEWRFNYGNPAQLRNVLKTWIETPLS